MFAHLTDFSGIGAAKFSKKVAEFFDLIRSDRPADAANHPENIASGSTHAEADVADGFAAEALF